MSILSKLNLGDRWQIDDLYNTFLGLEKKQQILAVVGGVVVLLIVLALPVKLVTSKLGEKEADYQDYAEMAGEFYALKNQFDLQKGQIESLTKRVKGRDPLKQIVIQMTDAMNLDRGKVDLSENSSSKGDVFTELSKDVKIQNIRMDDAIKLLSRLDQNEEVPIKITKLNLKANSRNKMVIRTMTFTLVTYRPN